MIKERDSRVVLVDLVHVELEAVEHRAVVRGVVDGPARVALDEVL